MRGLRAGVLAAAAAAACGLGCKDNPGFALAPDGPAESSTSDADTGSSTTPEVSTSFDPDTTAALTTTTGDDTTLTTTTGPPERFCGDQNVDEDLGEECDDGDKVPHNYCTNECRTLFAKDTFNMKFAGTCIGLLAAPFTADDESVDLGLVRVDNPIITVIENDGTGKFAFDDHSFSTNGNVVSAALARQVNPDPDTPKDRTDVVTLANVVGICLNKTADGYCMVADEYEIPMDYQVELGFLLPGFLQAGDVDDDGDVDVVTLAKDGDAVALYAGGPNGTLIDENFKQLDFPAQLVGGMPTAIALGPFDGVVEHLDLAVGYETNQGGAVMLFVDFGVNGFAEDVEPIPIGPSVTSLAIADLGFPGVLGDVLVADPEGGKLHFLGDLGGDTLELRPESYPIGLPEMKVVVGPLRGEGSRDIVTIDVLGSNFHLAAVVDDVLPGTSYPFHTDILGLVDVVIADVDQDGDGDVALVNGGCAVQVFINQTVVN